MLGGGLRSLGCGVAAKDDEFDTVEDIECRPCRGKSSAVGFKLEAADDSRDRGTGVTASGATLLCGFGEGARKSRRRYSRVKHAMQKYSTVSNERTAVGLTLKR